MTTRYVGTGGKNANTGLSWAQRKLTLNGVEDTPVAAGDVVYVGPGTYREQLVLDVSGTAGNLIQYIADYTGANTDGVGGVVRITGSDNDQTATRNYCVEGVTKAYRKFQGFVMDAALSSLIEATTPTGWVLDECYFTAANPTGSLVNLSGANLTGITVSNCYLSSGKKTGSISYA